MTLFSATFGSHDAFDQMTTQLVRDSGYTLACTGTGGLARQGSLSVSNPPKRGWRLG